MSATFLHLFVAAAAVATAAGAVSWSSTPPSLERVFNSSAQHLALAGEAVLFTPPRGAPQLRVANAQGRTGYVSCIALPEVCARLARGSSAVALEAVVFPLSSTVIWPVSVKQPAFASITPAQSRLRYVEYLDYQGSFWHFWAGLAVVMLGFGAWFKDRPLFGERSGASASPAKGA